MKTNSVETRSKTPIKSNVKTPNNEPKEPKNELKEAFDNFDVFQNGKLDIKEVINALSSLGYHTKNFALYDMLKELDTPENEKSGVSFDQFSEHFNKKVNDTDSQNGAKQIFNVFVDDPVDETVSLTSLKRICREIGEPINDPMIKEMIEKASNTGFSLNFNQYYDYLNKSKSK